MGMMDFFVMLLGVAFMVASPVWAIRVWHRRRTWPRVDATIVSVKKRKVKKHDQGLNPNQTEIHTKFRFTDATGETYIGHHVPLFRKPKRGDTLPIRYNPETPELNETATRASGLAAVVIAFLLGVLIFVWGYSPMDG